MRSREEKNILWISKSKYEKVIQQRDYLREELQKLKERGKDRYITWDLGNISFTTYDSIVTNCFVKLYDDHTVNISVISFVDNLKSYELSHLPNYCFKFKTKVAAKCWYDLLVNIKPYSLNGIVDLAQEFKMVCILDDNLSMNRDEKSD